MLAVVALGWDRGILLGGKSSILIPSPPYGFTQVVRPVLIGMYHTPEKQAGDWGGYCIVP